VKQPDGTKYVDGFEASKMKTRSERLEVSVLKGFRKNYANMFTMLGLTQGRPQVTEQVNGKPKRTLNVKEYYQPGQQEKRNRRKVTPRIENKVPLTDTGRRDRVQPGHI